MDIGFLKLAGLAAVIMAGIIATVRSYRKDRQPQAVAEVLTEEYDGEITQPFYPIDPDEEWLIEETQ